MRQKFSKLSFVHIKSDDYFLKDFDAIINGTYSQLFGGKDIDSYDVYRLKDGKIVDHNAWFDENQISLLDEQDKEKAEEMIEEYNFEDDEDEE